MDCTRWTPHWTNSADLKHALVTPTRTEIKQMEKGRKEKTNYSFSLFLLFRIWTTMPRDGEPR